MSDSGRNFNDDSYDEVEEFFGRDKEDDEESSYFPIEESKPPHY